MGFKFQFLFQIGQKTLQFAFSFFEVFIVRFLNILIVRHLLFKWSIFLLLFFFGNVLFAQPVVDTSALKTEALRLGINTFSMGSVGDWRKDLQKNQKIRIQSGQYSIYNKALPSNRFIVNNLWANVFHSWRISRFWAIDNEAWQYSYFANSTRLAQAVSTIRFIGWENGKSGLVLTGGAGLVNDKRLNNNNSGRKLAASGEYYTQILDSTLLFRMYGNASNTNINPRTNSRISGLANISKEFASSGLLSGEIGYLKSRVEDYLSNDIQSIISDTLYGKVRIRYEFAKNMVFNSESQYMRPNRAFFYRNAESDLETRNVLYFQDEYQSQNSLQINSRRFKINILFELRQRNRVYDVLNRSERSAVSYAQDLISYRQRLEDEKIKDIREQTFTYSGDGKWKISRNHLLRMNYVAQLLRVDTKSELNNQDRDEILYADELSHEWTLLQNFKLINKFSVSFRHLIFIEASQSSENFKDRILRWEPGFRWSNGRLNWAGQLGIWATYQVRDFEAQQDKNRSNRVLIMAHQADFKLNSRFKLLADLLRRESRLSQLNWEGFSESPIDTVTIYDLSLKTQYAHIQADNKELAVQFGYRAYWQLRKNKASLADPEFGARLIFLRSYIVQQGPQLRFLWTKNDRFRFMAEFWLQLSSQYFKYKTSTDVFLGNSFTREQLDLRDNRFQPYFTIQGLWYLSKRRLL